MSEKTSIQEKALVVAAALWLVAVIFQGLLAGIGKSAIKVDYALSGQFGDSFGSLSAFMASAAAVGAWKAVSMQRIELNEARASALDAAKQLQKRDFESVFFNLLTQFQNTRKERFVDDTNPNSASTVLSRIVEEFALEVQISDDPEGAYRQIYFEYIEGLAVYHRLLYNILKICENSDIDDCYYYIKIIRSFLSESELTLIALNGIYHEEANENLLPLINRYCLLNNLTDERIFSFKLRDFYEESAFNRKPSQA